MVKIKAQLTIQYLASFIFFVGIVILIYLSYSTNIPRFVEEVNKENTRSKAYQLSEILINNPGKPINWDSSNVKRIGLSDHYSNKSNIILSDKITSLDQVCNSGSNFVEAQKKLGLNRSFSIFIFEIEDNGDRTQLLSCTPPVFPKTGVNATVRRITALNDSGNIKLAEIIVQM